MTQMKWNRKLLFDDVDGLLNKHKSVPSLRINVSFVNNFISDLKKQKQHLSFIKIHTEFKCRFMKLNKFLK